jgi:streptomycin 6-kinase
MFDKYLTRWALTPDGHPVVTRTSRLLPVRQQGVPAMLKVAIEDEERLGGLLMAWWNGQGAAPVLAHDSDAVLLERAEGGESLTEMAQQDRDEEASQIICAVVAELHAPRRKPMPSLVPLTKWFSELEPAAAIHGGILLSSATVARELLAAQRDVQVLHGDIHHANILDFGPKGWLAIDPKDFWANVASTTPTCSAILPTTWRSNRAGSHGGLNSWLRLPVWSVGGC